MTMQVVDSLRNVPALSHEELKEIIVRFYERTAGRALKNEKVRRYLPLFVWGTFGIGKTYAVKKAGEIIAKMHGLEYSDNIQDIDDPNKFCVITIALHHFDPAELKGLGFPDKEKGVTVFYPPETLPRKGQGIIFLDELNLAPPLVQANAYQLVLERRIGKYVVPPGYMIIAAGNTDADRAYTYQTAAPLNNRFFHCKLNTPTVEEWIKDFAIPEGIDIRILGFLSFREDYLHKFNPENYDKIVPTPRMWDHASEAIIGIEDEEMLRKCIGMAVGYDIATEFVSWLRLSKDYNISHIFETGTIPDFPHGTELKKVSIRYALSTAIAHHYSKLKEEDKNKYASTIVRLADYFLQDAPEEAVRLIFMIQTGDKRFIKRLRTMFPETYNEFKEKYGKYVIDEELMRQIQTLRETLEENIRR